MMITLGAVRAAVAAAAERLSTMGCYALPLPTSIDVAKELHDKHIICSVRDVRAACDVLAIRLADSDWAGHDGPTLRLQLQEVDASGSD